MHHQQSHPASFCIAQSALFELLKWLKEGYFPMRKGECTNAAGWQTCKVFTRSPSIYLFPKGWEHFCLMWCFQAKEVWKRALCHDLRFTGKNIQFPLPDSLSYSSAGRSQTFLWFTAHTMWLQLLGMFLFSSDFTCLLKKNLDSGRQRETVQLFQLFLSQQKLHRKKKGQFSIFSQPSKAWCKTTGVRAT